jgi:hypothetical protein
LFLKHTLPFFHGLLKYGEFLEERILQEECKNQDKKNKAKKIEKNMILYQVVA